MKRKLHICLDGRTLEDNRGTGIATYTINLAKNLQLAGHQVSLLTSKNLKLSRFDLLNESIFVSNDPIQIRPFHRLRILKCLLFGAVKSKAQFIPLSHNVKAEERNEYLKYFSSAYNLSNVFSFAKILFRLTRIRTGITLTPKPDIMHWTCPTPIYARKCKNVVTLHDLIPLMLPYATKDDCKEFYYMAKRVIDKSAKVVTDSEYSKKDIDTYFDLPKNKIINTYLHLDLPKPGPSKRHLKIILYNQYNLHLKNYFIFVGAIEPRKNITRLINAFQTANVQQPLVLVGPFGWETGEDLSKYKVENCKIANVIRLEYLSRQNLNYLIAGAKALLFPSLYEGFGLPVIEAMALGTPTLTSNTTSLPEIASDSSLFVNPEKESEIAKGIYELATDELLCEQLAIKGLNNVKRFDNEKTTKIMEGVYYDALDE